MIRLSCGHFVHNGNEDCIGMNTWANTCRTNRVAVTCPMCRRIIEPAILEPPITFPEGRIIGRNVTRFEHHLGTITADFIFSVIATDFQDDSYLTIMCGYDRYKIQWTDGYFIFITPLKPEVLFEHRKINNHDEIVLLMRSASSDIVQGDFGVYLPNNIPNGNVLAENVFRFEHQFGTITADFSFSLIENNCHGKSIIMKYGNDYTAFFPLHNKWYTPYGRWYFNVTQCKVGNLCNIDFKKIV